MVTPYAGMTITIAVVVACVFFEHILTLFRSPVLWSLSALVYLQHIHVYAQFRSTHPTSVIITFPLSQHANPHHPHHPSLLVAMVVAKAARGVLCLVEDATNGVNVICG